jgi:hypothetical protein
MPVLIVLFGVAALVAGVMAWRGWGKDVPSPFHPGGAGVAVMVGLLCILGGSVELARQILGETKEWWVFAVFQDALLPWLLVMVGYVILNLMGLCPDFLMPPHQRRGQGSGDWWKRSR